MVCLVDPLRNSFRKRNTLLERGFVIHTIQGITQTQSTFFLFYIRKNRQEILHEGLQGGDRKSRRESGILIWLPTDLWQTDSHQEIPAVAISCAVQAK